MGIPDSKNGVQNGTDDLLHRAARGERDAVNELLEMHRSRLTRMISCRLDPRLNGRVDQSDIIQEAYLEAAKKMKDYFQQPRLPFFLWLRSLVGYKLLEMHRRHLGVKARDARKEISIYGGPLPEATTTMLAEKLLGRLSTPSQIVSRAEMKVRLQVTLNEMEPLDREVIALRHFEHMDNAETALALDLSEAAASSRYLRAIKRLRKMLEQYVDFFDND